MSSMKIDLLSVVGSSPVEIVAVSHYNYSVTPLPVPLKKTVMNTSNKMTHALHLYLMKKPMMEKKITTKKTMVMKKMKKVVNVGIVGCS